MPNQTGSAIFSPPPGILAAIKTEIDAATISIDACLYRFTEPTLAAALASAVARGVTVRVIMDKKGTTDPETMAWQLSATGCQVFTDDAHSFLHTKFCIFDSSLVCDGSANWTKGPDLFNAESWFLIQASAGLLAQYQNNWDYHRSHSIPLPR